MPDYQIFVTDETRTLGGEGCPADEIAHLSGYVDPKHLRKLVDAIRTAYNTSTVKITVREKVTHCKAVHESGGICKPVWPSDKGWAGETNNRDTHDLR